MPIGDRLKRMMRGKPAEAAGPTGGEIAYAGTQLYQRADIQRYNPDVLIGKKGIGIYGAMLKDDQIKALSSFLKHATLSRGFVWQIDDDHPDAEAQAEFVEWWDAMLTNFLVGTWTDKLFDLQSAHDFGFAISEKITEPWDWRGKVYWGLRNLKLRPAETFQFKSDPHGNVTEIIQSAGGKQIVIDPKRVVHLVNRADIDPQFGRSDLYECYRAYWSKDVLIKFWNMYLERMAGGFVFFEETAEQTQPIRTDIDALAAKLQFGSAFRIPMGIKTVIQYPTDTQAFEKAIAAHDKAISKALQVPNLLGLSEQGDTGSYAQAQTQLEAFFFTLESRARRLADTIVEQIARPYAFWNFGLTELPRYEPGPLTQSLRVQIADAWTNAVQGGAAKYDEASEQYMRELLGFPARAEAPEAEVPPVLSRPQLGGPKPTETADVAGGDLQPEERREEQYAEGPAARVNFSELERWSDALIDSGVSDLGDTMNAIWDSLSQQIIRRKLGTRGSQDKITDLEIPAALKAQIRRQLNQGMQATWKKSMAQARSELPSQAVMSQYAITAVAAPGMDDDDAESYIRAHSFNTTRKLTEDILASIKDNLLTAAKYDKVPAEALYSVRQMMQGKIPKAFIPGEAESADFVLRTIIKTSYWDVINEARQTFFTSPDLDGFVEAMEFSAILDDRTTEICEHMNGRVYPADSPYWDGRRPPMHHNCRSLLIPITVLDEWKASKPPSNTILPQKGFM